MKAKKIDPKKRTPAEQAQRDAEEMMRNNEIARDRQAKVAAARKAVADGAKTRDKVIKDGSDYQGHDSKGNPLRPVGGHAVVANTLGGDGPKMDTGRGVRGGTASQVRKAKRRVGQSAASPQAKRSARRLY